MKKLPRISESEWLVMQIFWSAGALTADEVVKKLAGKTKWKPKTVKTLITRLVKKAALGYEKEGRKYRYGAVVGEAECAGRERRSFVRRVYGGTMQPMLAAFLEDAELSTEEIAGLKKVLDAKGGN